jgi:hypothetical protein
LGFDPPRAAGSGRGASPCVVETASRLTAIGSDVARPSSRTTPASTTPPPGRRLRGARRNDRLPWVLLSGGVDDATFERQVVAAAPGRLRRLVGRSCGRPPRRGAAGT